VKTKEVVEEGLVEDLAAQAHDPACPAARVRAVFSARSYRCPPRGPRGHAAADDRTPLGSDGAAARGHRSAARPAVPDVPSSARGYHLGDRLHGDGGAERRPARALSVVNGAFSERFANLVRACDKSASGSTYRSAAPSSPTCCATRCAVTAGRRVTLVHSETSTGVLQDVEALASVVRRVRRRAPARGRRHLARAALPSRTDRWGRASTSSSTGSQKALALPPDWRSPPRRIACSGEPEPSPRGVCTSIS